MINNNSPLETLAAFAIVFVAGVVSTAGIGAYISALRPNARAQGDTSGDPVSAGCAHRQDLDTSTSVAHF